MMLVVVSVVAAGILTIATWVFVLWKLVVVVPPHRVGVLTGGGGSDGYRVVSGRAVRMPIIQRFDLMPELPSLVSTRVDNAYFRGGTPGPIACTATLRYHRGGGLRPAIERFLGQPTDDIRRVAAETLAGTLRSLAAGVTQEELERDPQRVTDALQHLAQDAFEPFGLDVTSVSLGAAATADDTVEARLREAGMLDIATATELACDLGSDVRVNTERLDLAAAGHPRLTVTDGRATLRWDSAHVSPAQLLAGARALAALRADPAAYR